MEAELAFWALLGLREVERPAGLDLAGHWVQRDAIQLHLLEAEVPVVPAVGHVALVVSDYDTVVARLRAAGHAAQPRTEYWGAPRTKVHSPAGHLVELLAPTPGG
ncbi:unannotated protein [freshwater metagenome]|uniref:Unannotated protein n=1 Tax=freshwater metagenome TaxID=449393 RepID=A0A6J7JL89_9ZZZZ